MNDKASAKEPISGFVQVNGWRLHYLDWGGDGPPIAIVHATGFLARVYRPIAEALQTLGHVLSYDQAGHGDSERLRPEEVSWYRTADELEGFLIKMELKEVRAFGHSAGATAIAAVASRRPDLIARAVLVEPVIIDPADPRERPNDLYERTLKRKPSFDSFDAMYANFASKPPYSTWRPDVLRDYCEYGTYETADGRRVLKCPPEIEARLYQTARDFDGLSRLLKVKTPALVAFGEKSDSPGIDFAPRIDDGATRHTIVIPNGGHLVPMEMPVEVAALARDFLGRSS
jgi:pimeloyl-ACP methyl ester carboxylesterase